MGPGMVARANCSLCQCRLGKYHSASGATAEALCSWCEQRTYQTG